MLACTRIVPIFEMVQFLDQQKLTTIYIFTMFNQDIMYCFSQSHIKHLLHFNNPVIKQIHSLKILSMTRIDTQTKKYTTAHR